MSADNGDIPALFSAVDRQSARLIIFQIAWVYVTKCPQYKRSNLARCTYIGLWMCQID